jgi:L-alanine-DL-glutamate epimerase-like enolase superfamily enzyme
MTFCDSSIVTSVAASLCLITISADLAHAADNSPMTATELLSAFSGEDAGRFEAYFEYTEQSRIVGVEIHAVGMENTTARYSGQEGAYHEVNNILRITTADGFEGLSGVDTYYQGPFSDEHLVELRSVIPQLIEAKSLDPVEVATVLRKSRPDLSDTARASIDIALWDLAAKKANRALYEVLGAKRRSMEPYASLPFYETLPEYVGAVTEYAKLGFTIFKFHVWGSIEEDVRLVELVQAEFADTPYRFMMDLESVYDLEDALRLGRQMDEGLFLTFEAPIDDELLAQYAELRAKLDVLLIPAGYNIYSPDFIRQGIESGAWDAGRFDTTVVGGVSETLKLLTVANEAALPIDIQSWGHSLGQAVNLHLMLANERTPYFEVPLPKSVFEFGMKNGNLMDAGRVVAPDGPGLGIEVDWEHLATADFHVVIELDLSGAPE